VPRWAKHRRCGVIRQQIEVGKCEFGAKQGVRAMRKLVFSNFYSWTMITPARDTCRGVETRSDLSAHPIGARSGLLAPPDLGRHPKAGRAQGFNWLGGSLVATMVECETGVRSPSSTIPPASASR
jgi:hypothetical protein